MNDRTRSNVAVRPARGAWPFRLLERLRDDSGQELVELAVIIPVLLTLALGVIEFGGLLRLEHSLTSIAREGANIAARGATLSEVNQLMLTYGGEIDLSTHGGSITSRIVVENGVPRVRAQTATNGYAGHSRIGAEDDEALGVGALAIADGATFFTVELFYPYEDRTALSDLLGSSVSDTLYSKAVF